MDFLIGTAFEIVLITVGRVAVWLFSFGRWRGEALSTEEGRVFAAAGALSFVRNGQRVVTHTGQLFAGIATCAILILLGAAYAIAV